MADRVRIDIENGVADVRLARPDKMNAIDVDMFRALAEAGKTVAADPAVRAVVLSGEGRAFCAGLDVNSFQAMSEGKRDVVTDETARSQIPTRGQAAAWVWQQCPVPVIGAIHGVAFGGGCQIALGADIRYVTPDVKMSIMEIKWGLVPDMAGTQTLRRLARLDVIKELAFTGRVISGEEAVALGLATRVTETPREDALSLAREIAGKNPHAIRSLKRLLNASGVGSEEDGLALEWELQRTLIGSPNQVEAVLANFEKREPRFEDPP